MFVFLALSLELSSIFIGIVGGWILAREFWVGDVRDFNASNAQKVIFRRNSNSILTELAEDTYQKISEYPCLLEKKDKHSIFDFTISTC